MTEAQVKDFTDTSIFEGVIQFTAHGDEFRFEETNPSTYNVFKKSGNAFIFETGVNFYSRNKSIESLYRAYLKAMRSYCEEE